MNISLSTYTPPAGLPGDRPASAAARAAGVAPSAAGALTVERHDAPPADGIGEVAGEPVRDDALGRAFAAAFTLPAPPPPAFGPPAAPVTNDG